MPLFRILLIEDDEDDVMLFKDALQAADMPANTIELLDDGERVLEYFNDGPELPHVIVMDMNLPRMHGREIMKHIRANPRFDEVPLIVLTTSSAREDMEYSTAHGANAYIIKPCNLPGIRKMAKDILAIAAGNHSVKD